MKQQGEKPAYPAGEDANGQCLSATTASIRDADLDDSSEWMTAINSEIKAGQQIILKLLMKTLAARPFISTRKTEQVYWMIV